MYKGSLAIAGECLCTRPFSMHDEPEFLELIRILREADTTYCHLEMNLHDKETYPLASAHQSDPLIAHELKWAGIDIVSCANNLALGLGVPGLLGTTEALDKAGLVHAGTGNNLEEAREPAYFESRGGRVAIISISSGHHPHDSASPTKSPARGRPGVNPLRITKKYLVTPEHLEKLKEIWKALGLSQRRSSSLQEEGDVCLNTGDYGGSEAAGLIFRTGDEPRIVSIPNKWDLEANIRAIKDARRQADLVLVAHHTALNEGTRGETPCKFVAPFAKQCIDAGADAFVGHGWHHQLGIEIYKGKPIWYGTGNFFAQSQFMKRFPADAYEGHGFTPDDLPKLTPADLYDSRQQHNMPHWSAQPGGVIAVLGMERGEFNEMKLYPFSLGYDYAGANTVQVRETGIRMEGRPMLADKKNGEKIIDHIKRLSETFNTRIEYKNGIGVLKFYYGAS